MGNNIAGLRIKTPHANEEGVIIVDYTKLGAL